MRALLLAGALALAGCGHLILAPAREHACREAGGVPWSSYTQFGRYEQTTCYRELDLQRGIVGEVLWSR